MIVRGLGRCLLENRLFGGAVSALPGAQQVRNASSSLFSSANMPQDVIIYEVGPRDGLQNEKGTIETRVKVDFINMLSDCGLKKIEATSFVSPKWVPQLGDASQVMQLIERRPGVSYPVLAPNLKVAIFAAASEAFSKKNTNCTIEESLKRFQQVTDAAKELQIPVRGYVSCAVGCPYQGDVDPAVAADVAGALIDMGCYEVGMSDTIGTGTPASVQRMFEAAMKKIPVGKLAAHMHDTYGQAIANILASLQMGVATIDSSVAGLGGCPYAEGASGNVATEDVVYLLDGLGIRHGVDMGKLLDASDFICKQLGRENSSRAAKALLAKRARPQQTA